MCEKECLHAPVCAKSKKCILGRIQGTEKADCAYFLSDAGKMQNFITVDMRPDVQPGAMLYVVNETNTSIQQYCVSECFSREGKWFVKITHDKGSLIVTETLAADKFNAALGKTYFRKYRDAIMSQIAQKG